MKRSLGGSALIRLQQRSRPKEDKAPPYAVQSSSHPSNSQFTLFRLKQLALQANVANFPKLLLSPSDSFLFYANLISLTAKRFHRRRIKISLRHWRILRHQIISPLVSVKTCNAHTVSLVPNSHTGSSFIISAF